MAFWKAATTLGRSSGWMRLKPKSASSMKRSAGKPVMSTTDSDTNRVVKGGSTLREVKTMGRDLRIACCCASARRSAFSALAFSFLTRLCSSSSHCL